MPKPARTAADHHHVVVLAYDSLCLFEFGIALEVFGMDRPEAARWYRCSIAAVEPGPLRGPAGVGVIAHGGPELLASADTIVIPGWRIAAAEHPIREALVEAHQRGARLLSICSGAFLLAAAGLLDGRRATTHWMYADKLARDYPALELVRDVLYVDGETILTSAGSAAGLDLCLHLVRKDFGAAAANAVARRMVVPPHREGGQKQYVERPVPTSYEAGRISSLIDRLRGGIDRPVTLAALARSAGMSRRTFVRRFKETTGLPPGEWVRRERILRARELLEETDAPVEEIARLSGFGSPAGLRHHFGRHVGVTPTHYRRQFGSVGAKAACRTSAA